MKTAFAFWENRIAPVFDTARWVLVVESEADRVVHKQRCPLADDSPLAPVLTLMELRTEALVCGAISRAFQDMLVAYGIQVYPFVAGDLGEVVEAWQNGALHKDSFAMPGCRGRNGRGRQQLKREEVMQGRGRQTGGRGGQGQGLGLGGRRRREGAMARGPGGDCFCPKCGHQESHEQGKSCATKVCPQCGTTLIRQ
jgi:predicted Fe-Mo cluster-binding NifX family protein